MWCVCASGDYWKIPWLPALFLNQDKVCEEMDYCAEDDSSRDEDMEDDDDEAAEQSRKQQAESEKGKVGDA